DRRRCFLPSRLPPYFPVSSSPFTSLVSRQVPPQRGGSISPAYGPRNRYLWGGIGYSCFAARSGDRRPDDLFYSAAWGYRPGFLRERYRVALDITYIFPFPQVFHRGGQ